MNLVSFTFYFFEAVAALAAIGLAISRNVFHGALLLIVCLLALAGIYVLAFAEFVAVTQILIYAGGILVVIIFGIMLTTKIAGQPMRVEHGYTFSGILVAGGFFSLLAYVFSREAFLQQTTFGTTKTNEISTIGLALFSKYMLPFEVAGLLLLIALIGAAVIASTIKST